MKLPQNAMPRVLSLSLVTVVLACVLVGCKGSQPKSTAVAKQRVAVVARYGDSVRGTIDGMSVLVLRGDHRQRGEALGFLTAQETIDTLETQLIPLVNSQSRFAWDMVLCAFARRLNWEPRYEQQLEGIMTGLEAALSEDGRILKSLDREIAIDDIRALNVIFDCSLSMACSSFSVWGDLTEDGHTIVGRNLDYYAELAQFPMCVIANDPADDRLMSTIDVTAMLPMIGAGTVMNDAGVFVAVHDERGLSVDQAEDRAWAGRLLTLRKAIEQAHAATAVDDMAGVLRKNPVLVGNNVHISTNGDSTPAILEWDGNPKDAGVTVRRPSDKLPEAIFCTNHYCERARRRYDCRRYDTMTYTIEQYRKDKQTFDFDDAKKLLDDVSMNSSLRTLQSVVAWPNERKLAVAFSNGDNKPATQGDWVVFTWAEIFDAR